MRSAIVIISSPCFLRELRELGHARHRAVLVHDLADDARPGTARRCARGRRRLRSARRAPARRPAARAAGTRGPGRARSRGLRRRVDRRVHGARRDRPPRCRCVVAAVAVDGHAERRVEARRVVRAPSAASRSSSSRSAVIARQIRPRPWRAMKLIASGVTFSAAIVRSPSFSRSSSSTTMIMRPARTASTASSIAGERGGGPARAFGDFQSRLIV